MPIDFSNPVSNHPLNDNLLSWWLPLRNNSGGQTLFDLCGKNNGTLTNGPTWGPGRSEEFGALTYDGTNDYVAGTTALTTLTDNYFAEVVFTPAVLPQGGHLFSAGDGGGAPGGFGMAVGNGGGGSGSQLTILYPGVAWLGFTTTFTAGVRYHAIMGRDNGTWRAWVNGVQDATTNTTTPAAMAARWAIGARNYGTIEQYFNGRIDAVRFVTAAPTQGYASAAYDQSLRGYPDLIRRYSSTRWFVGTGGGGSFNAAWASGSNVIVGSAF